MELKSVYCTSSFCHVKLIYIVKEAGYLPSSLRLLGTKIVALPENYQTINEVKQSGLYFDVENVIELRVGDQLTVYIENWFCLVFKCEL